METDIVYKNENGVAVTTSYLVAETFGKPHANVLRDIDGLHCSEGFHKLNFEFMFSIRELPNGGSRNERYCIMTKDGFTFLAMGYTGKKAGEFKERYINAFNAMEQQLKQGITHSLESLSRKQILQMALEAEEEKERMAARLALSEQKNLDLQASVGSILPRLEALEQQMKTSSTLQTEQPQVRIPKTTGRKKVALDPREIRKKYPQYKSSRDTLKWLKEKGIRIKNFDFYALMRQNGLISSDDATYNMPTDESVEKGWMIPGLSGTHQLIDGRHYYTPYFSPEGLEYILGWLKEIKTINETPLFAQS